MQVITLRSSRNRRWRHLADDDALSEGDITVSLERWRRQRDVLLARFRPAGVRLNPGDAVAEIATDLSVLTLVALDFGSFTEGRGYSQARLLRERFGYQGEIRALQARRDHVPFMARCGIDVFELHPCEDADAALVTLRRSAIAYQPAADGQPLIFRRRDPAEGERTITSTEGAQRR